MKAVLCNSGGLDSLYVARTLYDKHELHSVFINLGQECVEECSHASSNIATNLHLSHNEIIVSGLGPVKLNNNWFGIPYQAAIVALLGAAYAVKISAGFVILGVKDDVFVADFGTRFREFIGTSKLTPQVALLTPLIGKMQSEIDDFVKNDPIAKFTYSCNHSPRCGVCGRYISRKELGIDA